MNLTSPSFPSPGVKERWNPRYAFYAKSHGMEPKDALEMDRQRFPGGIMGGFLIWNSQKLRQFEALHLPKSEYESWLSCNYENVSQLTEDEIYETSIPF